MTHNPPHEQAARELAAMILEALTTAHAAGFAEARGMAAALCRNKADYCDAQEDAYILRRVATAIGTIPLTPPAAKVGDA